MSTPRRHVKLVIRLRDNDTSMLGDLSDIPVHVRAESDGVSLLILESGEMGQEAAEVYLSTLWTLAEPLMATIAVAGVTPLTCVLRVIEYVGYEDEIGPGVPIDKRWVAALAELNGSLDLDVYVQA